MEWMERKAGTARNLAIAAPSGDFSTLPLCVDLDGTLLATDSLHEAAVAACMADPRVVLSLPGWLAQARRGLRKSWRDAGISIQLTCPITANSSLTCKSRRRKAACWCWPRRQTVE